MIHSIKLQYSKVNKILYLDCFVDGRLSASITTQINQVSIENVDREGFYNHFYLHVKSLQTDLTLLISESVYKELVTLLPQISDLENSEISS